MLGGQNRCAAPGGMAAVQSAPQPVTGMRERVTVLGFAALVLLAIVGSAFAVGYILGKLLL